MFFLNLILYYNCMLYNIIEIYKPKVKERNKNFNIRNLNINGED